MARFGLFCSVVVVNFVALRFPAALGRMTVCVSVRSKSYRRVHSLGIVRLDQYHGRGVLHPIAPVHSKIKKFLGRAAPKRAPPLSWHWSIRMPRPVGGAGRKYRTRSYPPSPEIDAVASCPFFPGRFIVSRRRPVAPLCTTVTATWR